MEKNTKILIGAGVIITGFFLFIDMYLAGITAVIFITLIMMVQIMQDTAGMPDITAHLREDAKALIFTNKGNARAEKIHVALVPANTEFDIPSIEADADYEFLLPAMTEEIKVVITYNNEKGQTFSHSQKLSALEEEPDILKPLIPLFKWKK